MITQLSVALLLRRAFNVGGIVGTGMVALAGPGVIAVAHAHDAVLHATPEDGSVVDQFPRKIILEFSGIPKDNFNTIAVTDSGSGDVLFTAEPDRDKQFMSVTVPDDIHPGPGNYIVGFQITSSDGHATRGKTSFTVATPPSTAVATASDAAATEMESSQRNTDQDVDSRDAGVSLGAIVGAMALVAVCGGAIVTMKKRK